ncbi:MAG: MaoC family dehydratase [bacterium]|nr:MaoC family dehydratase [bacterium]
MKPKEERWNDIKIGNQASFKKTIVSGDLIKFAEISGDYNPLHLDEEYAVKTEFKGRIVHGMFLASLISRLVGMELPGKKALLLKECLEFKKPAKIGDKILVLGRVVYKSEALRIIELSVEISAGKEMLASGSVSVRVLN